MKIKLEQVLKQVHLLEKQKNCIAENLTTEGQKFKKAEQEIETLKIELQKVNSEKEDLQGRLKITLSELEVKQASLNKMNTGSRTRTNILCNQKFPFDRSSLGYNMMHPLQILKLK